MVVGERSFAEIAAWQRQNQEHLCVGLDTDQDLLLPLYNSYPGLEFELRRFGSLDTTADYVLAYNKMIITATADLVGLGAYKPNAAFYEALGDPGFSTLRQTVAFARTTAPRVMNILDAKRQDIGSTNKGYGQAYFDIIGFDAMTVHPYLGAEALKILTDRKDRGFLVMGRTSNPGAGEFQNEKIFLEDSSKVVQLLKGPVLNTVDSLDIEYVVRLLEKKTLPLHEFTALRVARHWNINGNCGLVAGATWPKESGEIRSLVGPNLFLLIPGVGAQGGEASDIVPEALRRGELGVINSSRGIIFAERGDYETQFEAIRRSAITLRDEIVTTQNLIAA